MSSSLSLSHPNYKMIAFKVVTCFDGAIVSIITGSILSEVGSFFSLGERPQMLFRRMERKAVVPCGAYVAACT